MGEEVQDSSKHVDKAKRKNRIAVRGRRPGLSGWTTAAAADSAAPGELLFSRGGLPQPKDWRLQSWSSINVVKSMLSLGEWSSYLSAGSSL